MLTGQTGVVTKNPGWYGRMVQVFTASPAYHCIYAISDDLCVSAEVPYVVVRPISDFVDVEWTDEPMTDEGRADAVHWAALQAGCHPDGTPIPRMHGKPYAYWDIFLLAVARILKRKTPDPILEQIQDTRALFCSELCDLAMIAAGVNMFPGIPACAVVPDNFQKAIRERAQVR